MKIILCTLLSLSLMAGVAAFADDNPGSGGKTHSRSSGSKRHGSNSHRNTKPGSRKKAANIPSGN